MCGGGDCGILWYHTSYNIISHLPSPLIMQPPALPPKGIKNSLNCDAYDNARKQEGMMGFLGSSQNTTDRRHSYTLDSTAVADQSGYEPLHIRPNRSGSEVRQVNVCSNHYMPHSNFYKQL